MFVNVGVPTCSAVLRNLMYRFMCRASESVNNIIAVLTNHKHSSVKFSSRLWKHWRTCLYTSSWVFFGNQLSIHTIYCIYIFFSFIIITLAATKFTHILLLLPAKTAKIELFAHACACTVDRVIVTASPLVAKQKNPRSIPWTIASSVPKKAAWYNMECVRRNLVLCKQAAGILWVKIL